MQFITSNFTSSRIGYALLLRHQACCIRSSFGFLELGESQFEYIRLFDQLNQFILSISVIVTYFVKYIAYICSNCNADIIIFGYNTLYKSMFYLLICLLINRGKHVEYFFHIVLVNVFRIHLWYRIINSLILYSKYANKNRLRI